MGTNYYRIPSVQEMNQKKSKLIEDIKNIDISPHSIIFNFKIIDDTSEQISYWAEFVENTSIHLGKRSSGWKFLWNFNDNKYYSNKEELFNFIKSGRIVNEYGTELDIEEFITMSLEWGQPDGLDMKKYRQEHPRQYHYDFERQETYIDGLRVSPNNNFC
jgi:hypothetical protein